MLSADNSQAMVSIAMLAGIALGLVMGLRRKMELALGYLIPIALTIPTLLAVFLCVLWFGFSEAGGFSP